MTEPADRFPTVDEGLARALVEEQFPEWRHLPLRPVERSGNDHRMFRLGAFLSVRLPSAPDYVPQVAKEQAWLPRLGERLPLPIPQVRGVGRPSASFPSPWSVYGWLPGEPALQAVVPDKVRFAHDLAAFLTALRAADPTGGPAPGLHSAYRGGPLERWDDEVRAIVRRVHGRERDWALGIWKDALSAPFHGDAVWVHGDVSAGNLLIREGRLSAVVDFGCSAVGDPSCDTVIEWTYLDAKSRAVFRRELGVDEATWARGRGWAIWKALIMITNKPPGQAELARRVLDELFAER